MNLKVLIAGILGVCIMGSAARAADIQPVFIPAPAPIAIPVVQPHDWGGFYVGAGLLWARAGSVVQGSAGFNFTPGRLVVGVEATVGKGNFISLTGSTLAGVALGAQGRLLAYTKASLFYVPALGRITSYTVVGGLEVALGARLSIFGEAGIVGGFTGTHGPVLVGGVRFHFGR